MVRNIALAIAVYATVLVACAANLYAQSAPTWRDVLSTCAEEWKASDTRKNTPKGEGMAAWQSFLSECKARKGFVPKSQRTREFTRVPDKT